MILNGNPRGNATELADHLMKAENEVVQLFEMRGFVARDLLGAFNEAHALSKATKCDEFLYSLSLNPPHEATVSDVEFIAAIDEAEKRLNLSGQPRAVVFHEKNGRRHAHVVWSRIDAQTMTARHQSFDKMKLTAYSRELFLQYGWEMPDGIRTRGERSPTNYTHAEYQQAQRVGKHAGRIKEEIQGAWARSDTTAAFEAALMESGYMLARGDRRGFVVVDEHGEVYSLPRMLGIKTKEVRARLVDPALLPSVEEVQKAVTAQREKAQAAAPTPKTEEKKKPMPEQALTEITRHHSAFTLKMAERTLKAVIANAEERNALIYKVIAQKNIVQIGHAKGEPVYAAQEYVDLESKMLKTAKEMVAASTHKTDDHALRRAVFTLESELAHKIGGAAYLSEEQITALKHMTNDKQLSLVVGVAGAGKTTIMQGAKDAFEAQGYRVRGAAPSGIAAGGLREIGVNASTLHALEGRIATAQKILDENTDKSLTPNQRQFIKDAILTDKDVLIVDEAGMVSAKQLNNIMTLCRQSGAKLVLVGDPEKLQSVEAGTAFKDILERTDSVAITEVRRQHEQWQKDASILFAHGNTEQALKAYDTHDAVTFGKTRNAAAKDLIRDYLAGYSAENAKNRLVLAYTRKDVATLNQAIKAELVKAGAVSADNTPLTVTVKDGRNIYQETQNFAIGDRICFRENNAALGVMNGSFGRLEEISQNSVTVTLDNGKTVTFDPKEYNAITLGYAATVHKAQGVTVDDCFVLASPHFDKHTTYVAMTRHKHNVKLYASKRDFKNTSRLFNALGKDGEKLSTLDFTDPQRKWQRPTLSKRIIGAAHKMRDRLFGKTPEKATKSKPHHRQTPTPEQRDRILAARNIEKPQHRHDDDHLSPTAINRNGATNLVTLRDKVLREVKKREISSGENDRRSHDYNPPTLER